MKLLAAKMYDPAVAVSKATSSLLAMTALDTTNLRLNVTVPAHGMVRFRGQVTITGATTFPVIYLGVLSGSTIIGRVSPTDFPGTANVATQTAPCMVDFVATGLTPGSTNFDLAYGVEVVVAATNIKYGGPNDTTTNNAWGAALFEAWDPNPYPTNFSALAITAGGIVSAAVTSIASAAIAAATFAANALDAVWSTAARTLTAGTNIVLAKGTGVTGFNDLSAAQVNAECDTAVGDAALATATNLAAAKTVVDAIKLKTDNLPSDPADESLIIAATDSLLTAVNTRLADADYTAPDNTNIAAAASDAAAIKAKTDSLTFTLAGNLDVNTLYVNGVAVTGLGTQAAPWGPA